MTTQYDRELTGFRFVESQRGDTLQTIAAREFGDASRWTDLITYNSLVPPFITDDASQVAPGVLLTGSMLMAPAPVAVASSDTDPEAVFGVDIGLATDGSLNTKNGDFAVVSGTDNLVQALENRLETDRGELLFHSTYGCDVRRLQGVVNGPTARVLGAQYAKAAVLEDTRISRVKSAIATSSGDTIRVRVEAEVLAGRIVTASASF